MEQAIRIVIVNKEGKILILKRNLTDMHYPGLWDIPGGGVDEGESLREAAERELKEECNLEMKIDGEYFNMFHHAEKQIDIYGFKANSTEKEITLSDEHTEFKWIKKDEWQNYEFIPSVTATLKAYFI